MWLFLFPESFAPSHVSATLASGVIESRPNFAFNTDLTIGTHSDEKPKPGSYCKCVPNRLTSLL